jgi:hypothetical protein
MSDILFDRRTGEEIMTIQKANQINEMIENQTRPRKSITRLEDIIWNLSGEED